MLNKGDDYENCWVWSLIILFTLYHSIGPLYLKRGGNAARNLIAAVGGPVGAAALFGAPPWQGFEGSAPEAKNRCKISL